MDTEKEQSRPMTVGEAKIFRNLFVLAGLFCAFSLLVFGFHGKIILDPYISLFGVVDAPIFYWMTKRMMQTAKEKEMQENETPKT